MAHTIIALGAFAAFAGGGPRRYPFLSADGNRTHVAVRFAWPLVRSAAAAADCAAVFDAATLAALGPGAACAWPAPDAGRTLLVRLGDGVGGVGLAGGTLLRSRGGPLAGYANRNTDLWYTSVAVAAAPGSGPPPACELRLGWEDLVALKARGERVRTGGLGALAAPPEYVVWACVERRLAAGACPPGPDDSAVCFRFGETRAAWEWLGPDGLALLGFSGR
jgi:hypothetical protein